MILSTIQKQNKLNTVYRIDQRGPGGAFHTYRIFSNDEDSALLAEINFQKGPRNAPDAIRGVTDEDLLEIVRDRLASFQKGALPTRENACALTHIEEALMWLNKRKEDRAERDVLGTYER